MVEPLITLGKTDSDANRRLAFSRLRDVAIVEKLFADLGPRFKARPGGYTRILRMTPRPGDSAPMALMQLVDGPVPVAAEAPSRGQEGRPRQDCGQVQGQGQVEGEGGSRGGPGRGAEEAHPQEEDRRLSRSGLPEAEKPRGRRASGGPVSFAPAAGFSLGCAQPAIKS